MGIKRIQLKTIFDHKILTYHFVQKIIMSIESEIDEDFVCPVCFDLMFEPQVASCGHSVCQVCSSITCHTCRKPTKYVNNWLLGQVIEKRYPEQYGKMKKRKSLEGFCEDMKTIYSDFRFDPRMEF